MAAKQDDVNIISLLSEGFPSEFKKVVHETSNGLGETVLHCCKWNTVVIESVLKDLSSDECESLINSKDKTGNTVLHLLTMPLKSEGQHTKSHPTCEQAISLLLNKLGDVSVKLRALNIKNGFKGTPFQYALDMALTAPEILHKILEIVSLPDLVSLERVNIENLYNEGFDIRSLTTHQHYVLTRILPFDGVTKHEALLANITKCDEQRFQQLQSTIYAGLAGMLQCILHFVH